MKKILWAIPHQMLKEQEEELRSALGTDIEIVRLADDPTAPDITYTPASKKDIFLLAERLINYALNKGFYLIVQPAGSPAFQFALGAVAGHYCGLRVAYAHSERVSVDEVQEDGSVKKTSVFKHKKFIFMREG